METNLVKLGFIKEEELLSFLSAQYRVPSIKLSKIEINPNVIKLIPASTAKKDFIIPTNRVGPKLTLAMVDPSNIFVIDEVKFMTGFNVEPVVASETDDHRCHQEILRRGRRSGRTGNASPFRQTITPWMTERSTGASGGLTVDDDVVNVDDFDALVHGAVDNVEVVESQADRRDDGGNRRSHHQDR